MCVSHIHDRRGRRWPPRRSPSLITAPTRTLGRPRPFPPNFPRRPFFFRSNSSLETLTVTALVIVTTTTTVVAFAWKDVQEARHGRLHPSRTRNGAEVARALAIEPDFVAYVVVVRRRLPPFRSTPTLPDLTICITVSCSSLSPSPRCRSVVVDPCPPEGRGHHGRSSASAHIHSWPCSCCSSCRRPSRATTHALVRPHTPVLAPCLLPLARCRSPVSLGHALRASLSGSTAPRAASWPPSPVHARPWAAPSPSSPRCCAPAAASRCLLLLLRTAVACSSSPLPLPVAAPCRACCPLLLCR